VHMDDNDEEDKLFRDYDTVLKESAILTTFGGVLFGFLLNISIRGANQLMEEFTCYHFVRMNAQTKIHRLLKTNPEGRQHLDTMANSSIIILSPVLVTLKRHIVIIDVWSINLRPDFKT